jgi:hypothetical protein
MPGFWQWFRWSVLQDSRKAPAAAMLSIVIIDGLTALAHDEQTIQRRHPREIVGV